MADAPPVHFQSVSAPLPRGGGTWIYLGWDVARRERLSRAWGRFPEPLGLRLSEAGERLRGPFLDLVAEWGRRQEDSPAWWAGTLAWKSWSASQLFQLCCYLEVAARVARERPGEGLVVVIEDPWLLRQVEAALFQEIGVPSRSMAELWQRRAAALLTGLARRWFWACRMAFSALRTAASQRSVAPPPPAGPPAVLIYSYLVERCLAGGRWTDPYLPGLEEELSAAGASAVRCTDPDVTGFERRLAVRGSVEPLMRWASLGGFLRALAALPPEPPGPRVLAGLPIELLVRREWWHDFSRSGRCAHLFFWDAAERLLSSRPWKALVLAWEGQPQERLLALAARRRCVKVVGSQHTTVSPWQLPFLLGRGEAEWAPFPDALLTAGPHPREVLAQGGVPESRLRGGGSRRFRAPVFAAGEKGEEILVVLPVDPLRARHLLSAISRAFPDGRLPAPAAVKPHPGDPHAARDLPFPARIAREAFAEAVKRSRLVVYTSTAAGLEALALGVPALRYRSDSLLDIDPSDVLSDELLSTASDADFKEALESMLREPRRPTPEAVSAALARLFEPAQPEAWRQEILGF
ncbi:MAG: hypothetical protein HY921_12925 [Elusimicrobia bacterium]|nr:hypothetical protein [Elusimicrobiota bacterium]